MSDIINHKEVSNMKTEEFSNQISLKELRKKANMTQQQFSEYFGIPKRNIENWENCSRSISEYLLDLIKYKLEKEELI